MKAMAIQSEQLEECMKFAQLERELVERLTMLSEKKKDELAEMKRINLVCEHLNLLQEKHKFRTSEEMVQKQLKKFRMFGG